MLYPTRVGGKSLLHPCTRPSSSTPSGFRRTLLGRGATPSARCVSQRRRDRLDRIRRAGSDDLRYSQPTLTGQWPSGHGIVGNGWYFPETGGDSLLATEQRAGRGAKRSGIGPSGSIPPFTCANMFWWYNMYSNGGLLGHARARCIRRMGRQDPPMSTRIRNRCDRSFQAKLGNVPALQLLGPGHEHQGHALESPMRRSRWTAS